MKLIILFTLSIYLVSCVKTVNKPVSYNYSSESNYFGLKKGNFIEYHVVHITHDDEVDIHDTIQFRFKTSIGDTFTDNQGRKTFKFFRYNWNEVNDTWKIKDVWSALIDGKNAILVEENNSIIKLNFPIKLSTQWNPTIFSTEPKERYSYLSLHTPLKVDEYYFDSTVTVIQDNYFTLVDYKRQTETYAKNIGMISKYYKNLRIKNFDTLQVKKGEEWFYKLTKFGNE